MTQKKKPNQPQFGGTIGSALQNYKVPEDKPGKMQRPGLEERRRTNRQRRTKEQNIKGMWRSADYDQASEFLTTEDSVNYFFIDLRYINDPQYIVDAQLKAIEYWHLKGDWDERVVLQETAYDNYCQALIKVVWNLAPMYVMHDLLKSFPTSTTANLVVGTGATTATTVPLFKKSLINQYLQDFENAGIVVPHWIKKLLKSLNFVVKFNKEWFMGGVTIPAHYYYPFIPLKGTTDLDAIIVTLKSNVSKAKKFMNFFGIPSEPLTSGDLEYTMKDKLDDDLIAWFSNQRWEIYDGGAARQISVIDETAALTGVKWFFKHGGSPNDSVINELIRLFYDYNAVYNVYGDLFQCDCPATQNYPSIFRCDEDEATELITTDCEAFYSLLMHYNASYKQTNTFNISMTGTYLSSDRDIAVWPLAVLHDLKYYSGITHTIVDGILVHRLAEWTGFTVVNKDSPKHKYKA